MRTLTSYLPTIETSDELRSLLRQVDWWHASLSLLPMSLLSVGAGNELYGTPGAILGPAVLVGMAAELWQAHRWRVRRSERQAAALLHEIRVDACPPRVPRLIRVPCEVLRSEQTNAPEPTPDGLRRAV